MALLFGYVPILHTVGQAIPDGAANEAITDSIAAFAASDIPADLIGTVVSISPGSDSKQYLDVKDSSRNEGAPVIAVKKRDGTGQRFEILSAGEGVYVIRSVSTGRLITEKSGGIVQTGMSSATDDTQCWAITKRSKGYLFTNAATGNRLSLAGSSAKPAEADSPVTATQIFKLEVAPIVLDGYYSFITQADNVIALSKNSIKNDTAFILKRYKKNTVGRQFFLISSSDGYHAVRNSISFKALSVKGASAGDGATFIQRDYKKKKHQRFKLVPSGDGWFLLKNALGSYVSASADEAKGELVTAGDAAKALKVRVRATEYSTGMPKLDAKIKKIRKKIGVKGDVVKKSFNYVITHYDYREHPNDFNGDWISRYAWYMVNKGYGHCKNYAATLCVFLRSYGYDARVVTGHVPSRSRGWAVHGWVEAKMNGKTYVFDPSFAHSRGAKGWYKRTYKNALLDYRIEKSW
jgi:hypothetical protein